MLWFCTIILSRYDYWFLSECIKNMLINKQSIIDIIVQQHISDKWSQRFVPYDIIYVYWPNGFRSSVYTLFVPTFPCTYISTYTYIKYMFIHFFSAHTNLRTWQAWQQTKCKAIKMVKKIYCLVRDNQYHNNMNKTKPVLVFGCIITKSMSHSFMVNYESSKSF